MPEANTTVTEKLVAYGEITETAGIWGGLTYAQLTARYATYPLLGGAAPTYGELRGLM